MKLLASLFSFVLISTIHAVASAHESRTEHTHDGSSSSGKKTSDDFLVQGLEEYVPAFGKFKGDFYSGILPTDAPNTPEKEREGGNLMFFMFSPDKPMVDDSLVIWFNGGPGCSSVAGMFFENSPIAVPLEPAGFTGSKGDDPLIWNEYGWTEATAIMYMEHPHGVGFSEGPEPQNEDDVARYFVNFLLNFYEAFPEFRSKRLYLSGESYDGYYVPSIGHKIHQFNKEIAAKKHSKYDEQQSINLRGITLGNGWVDARIQGPALVQYAYWHGLIDTTTKLALEEQWERCQEGKKMELPFHSFTTPDDCGMVGAVVQAAGGGFMEKYYNAPQFALPGVNIYDVTTWDGYAVLFDENSTYSQLFNNPRVQELLHAPDMHWEQCIPGAGRRKLQELHRQRSLLLLDQDKPESVMPYIAELLDDAEIDVLIYNGDRDMSTCSQGNEFLLDAMDWSGAKDWKDPHVTRRGLWVVDDMPAGYSRPLKNLNFVVVYNSGHLVPYNQPKAALDLITRYLKGTSFVDHELPIFEPSAAAWSKYAAKGGNPTGATNHKKGLHLHFVTLLLGVIIGMIGAFVYNQRFRKGRHQYEEV